MTPNAPVALGALLLLARFLPAFTGAGSAAVTSHGLGAAIAGVGLFALLRQPRWTGSALLFFSIGMVGVPFALDFGWTASPYWAHVIVGLATAELGILALPLDVVPLVVKPGR